jgi:3',5'-cyclic AMP phosphodiesterase CpdA
MFVLAHLSDPHLAPLPTPGPAEMFSKSGLGYLNWLRKRRSIHRPDALAAIVADLKARAPDHIAVTGDLVNLSLAAEFSPARAWLETLGGARDITVIPGNHDCYVRATADFAQRHWEGFMCGDAGEAFPFVRRRGPLALIGLSTALPTLPLAATGKLGQDQLSRLPNVLSDLAREGLFRVVLIHHPPAGKANRFRRLADAAALREVLHKHGAELVLHGHHHKSSLIWLSGPRHAVPCVGVPSASGAPGRHDEPAAYNLYEIEGAPGDWRCTAITRGLADGKHIGELARTELANYAAA